MKPLFVANWKMHGSAAFTREWAADIAAALKDNAKSAGSAEGADSSGDVAVCPPFPLLPLLRDALPAAIQLGAQNVAAAREDGAYTGEVSARLLAEAGCTLVIIGHSERRAMQHEDDALCAAKLAAAAAAGLRPLLCVGEDAATRGNGNATAAVLAQLDAALEGAADEIWQRLIIAYEPIWAIGSGKTPSADDIAAMHTALRERLIKQNAPFGDKITLLYGGSVNAANAPGFIGIPHVNGFLVGGASLKPREFSAICHSSLASS